MTLRFGIKRHRAPWIAGSTGRPRSTLSGFSLVDLLLALSLGIGLSGTILQALLTDSQLGLRMNRLLRERMLQERTLALVRSDVQRASRISPTPLLEQHACSLAGRLPVLHLTTATGTITYSVGSAPSGIWRGQVLMRCGPAFDLQGQPSAGSAPLNRVVIDGLSVQPYEWTGCPMLLGDTASGSQPPVDLSTSSRRGFSACLDNSGYRVAMRLRQEFSTENLPTQQLTREEVTGRIT